MTAKEAPRPAPDKVIGTAEAAAIAQVAQHTVNHWIRTRQLRARLTPTGYKFRAQVLYDFLASRTLVVTERRTWRRTRPAA